MNLPNRLTLLRILMIPFILLTMLPMGTEPNAWNLWIGGQTARWLTLILFSLASLTDYFDGAIARKRNIVTNMGKFLDPIADKLLVISVLMAFVQLNRIHASVVVIVLAREFTVTGIRLLSAERGVVIAASIWGKVKTVSQIISLIWLLAEPIMAQLMDSMNKLSPGMLNWITWIGNVLVGFSVIMTVYSGYDYFSKNRQVLHEKK